MSKATIDRTKKARKYRTIKIPTVYGKLKLAQVRKTIRTLIEGTKDA